MTGLEDQAPMSAVLRLVRRETGLSQRAFAQLVGTSGSTIAAYESGAKEPRFSTLERLAHGADLDLRVVASPRNAGARLRARRRRRSLGLAAAIASEVRRDFPRARQVAAENLERMGAVVGANRSRQWLHEWETILGAGPEAVRSALLALGPEGHDLRQMQPFAGLLSEETRLAALAAADAVGAFEH